MNQSLRAVYQNGSFVLQTALDLPEGTEVELLMQPTKTVAAPISNPDAKREFLKLLIERMQQNPVPQNAPQLTRDMLHERR